MSIIVEGAVGRQPGPDNPTRRAAVARRTAVAAGAGLSLAAVGTALSSPVAPTGWITGALHSFGVLLIVAGFVVSARSAAPRIGWLMVCCGGLYHLGDLRASEQPWLFMVGFCLAYLWTAVLAHIALALPTGRVDDAVSRALVVASYLAAVGTQVGRFVAERPQPPWWWNLTPPPTSPWATIGSLTYAALTLAVLVVVARRWVTSTRLRRRPAGPIWAATMVLGAAGLTVAVAARVGAPPAVHVGTLATALTLDLLVIPLVALTRRIRSTRAQSHAARVLLGLDGRQLPHPARLGRTLAEAVGDPALRVTYPQGGGALCAHGDLTPPAREAGQAVTAIRRHGAVIARIIHDEALNEQLDVTRTAFGIAGLAIENAILYRAQQARIEELRHSRLRVSTAGFEERRRIQRDLHDGAQQQLYAVLMLLDTIRDAPAAGVPAELHRIRATAGRAHLLLRDAISGLQQLTQGIYPAALLGHGLAGAVGLLAEVAPVPLDVRVPSRRWPRHVEVTAYFFIAEGVANAYKHARAERVTVVAEERGPRLHVEVTDDGDGGATARPGSGLSGLRDRIAAVGGDLTIASPAGGGTRLAATLALEEPCG
ncbi:sensor histidine kinase [Micromonospora halophytica]|uniref:histidine kinase n=1 Tax=Micromonospora halophytica TaxID=47864 RepID=A0A1C5GKT9_9ACTN|nr:histidine kinase [Micromonospora halophytica]SCG34418.1 Signal transduction histidine kinase [Micromonospora halophytica]